MNIKILKSKNEEVWLFDIEAEENRVKAGFACFNPHCPSEVEINIEGKNRTMLVPSRAMGSPVPSRILEARLSLLPLSTNE